MEDSCHSDSAISWTLFSCAVGQWHCAATKLLIPTYAIAFEGEEEAEEANSSGVASGDKSLGESSVEQPASHKNKTWLGQQVKLPVWQKDYIT